MDRAVHLLGPTETPEHRSELVVVGEIGTADDTRQRLPLLHGDRRDPHVATFARGLVAGDHHPPKRLLASAGEPRHQRRRRDVRQLDRFEHRRVDRLRDTGARRAPPSGQCAQRAERTDDVLAQPSTDGQRRQMCVAVRGKAAAARLQHLFRQVEPVIGPAVAERGDRNGDERPGARRRCRLRIPHDDDVGGGEPGLEIGRAPLRRAQVGEQGITVDRCAEHDVGAEIGQQLGAVRAGDAGRAVDDVQPVVDHASANIGTTTAFPGTVVNSSGRNETATGASATSSSGALPTT